jgi:hypothetical protein
MPLLRLQAFSTNHLTTPVLLYALPAASLTRLELVMDTSAAAPPSGSHAAALARLTNLQHLQLKVSDRQHLGVLSSMLPAVGQLSKLTHLQFLRFCRQPDSAPDAASHALRQLLQAPCREWQQQLRGLELSLKDAAAIDLSGFSGLQQLKLAAYEGYPRSRLRLQEGWVLPKQLQQLDIADCCIASPAALGILDMQQLQQLRLLAQFAEQDEQQALLQLAQLPCLQQLALEYADAAAVAATADIWRQLPALVGLTLHQAGQMTEDIFTSALQASSHLAL